MSNQPNTNKGELLKSIETALRGFSLIFYWIFVAIVVYIVAWIVGDILGGSSGAYFGYLVYVVVDAFVIVYGAHLIRRGIEGIGRYFNNHDLISKAASQFIWWIVTLVIPIIGLIFLGLRMRVISKTLHDLTGIEDFDTAADRWKLAAYLAIILIGGLIALFALYSTRKGFRGMVNQMVQ
jgi:uncharacterized membrane protein